MNQVHEFNIINNDLQLKKKKTRIITCQAKAILEISRPENPSVTAAICLHLAP